MVRVLRTYGLVSQTHSFKLIRPSPTTLTQFFTKLLYHKLTHSSTYDLLPPTLTQFFTKLLYHKLTHSSTYDLLPPTHTILYQVIVSQTHTFKHIRPSPTTHTILYQVIVSQTQLIQAHTTFSHHTHTILYQVIVSQTHSSTIPE